ncbi:hypothetical protein K449DRAFT_385511 [Hypoxylon sp. EC38]|nr:hypothetical protein K449DRAFT_385511 [Hypoxylon sp. EC38]
MNLTLAPNYMRSVWTPWQQDSWSCGIRTFWAARQMMDRILKLHVDKLTYSEGLWEPLSGWINVDFTRWEMIGLNAYYCVKDLDYRARVAVELVNQIDDGKGGFLDAGDTMRPPQGERKIERPTNARQPGQYKPNKRRKLEDDTDSDDSVVEISHEIFAPVPTSNKRRLPSQSIDGCDFAEEEEEEGEDRNSVWSRRSPERRGYPEPSNTASRPRKLSKPNLFSK